ncbi:MAG: DUF4097 family beta strand repeat-containing protein [Pyrinomonadaceae bacterium]
MSWLYTIIFAGLSLSSNEGTVGMPVDLPQTDAVIVQATTGDETEKFEQTYPLNANGRVSVSNVNGSITLEAWDKNEVKLVAVKTADSKERLAEVEINVESRPDYLDVETNYEKWKTRNGGRWGNHGKLEVDYQLMVPRGAILNEIETVNGAVEVSNFTNIVRISAVNGTVKAVNIRGTAKLSTVNGEVLADFDRLEGGSKIALETVNGRVNLTIPSDSSATIKADSLNGNITNDFGLTVRKGKYVGRDLYGRIGSGDVQIKLNSVNGGLSIGRKNDGKNLSPATNLLPQKGDDDDWDIQEQKMAAEADKLSKEAIKMKLAAPKPPKASEMAKINTEAIRSAEAFAKAAEALSSEEVKKSMREIARVDAQFARAMTAGFERGVPKVETKSGNFSVKGVPTVTINAEPCAVKVTGWDKNEVKYRVVQIVEPRRGEPLKVTENHSDSDVTIKVEEPKINSGQRYYGDGVRTRIEIFVPRKSNLKINANREIRIEGVTGNVDLVGADHPISVIDVDGSLKLKNDDGIVRVIGFRGEIDAETTDGALNLEGDFKRLKARAVDGAITLTLSENASADLTANCEEVRGEGISVTRVGGEEDAIKYRIGRGGAPFQINTTGAIIIRGASSLTEIY